MMLKSKYRNRRSVSYLSWKSNNDYLRKLYELLKERSDALQDFSMHVVDVEPHSSESSVVYNWLQPSSILTSYFSTKLVDYSKIHHEYFSSILLRAESIWKTKFEASCITELTEFKVPDLYNRILPTATPKVPYKVLDDEGIVLDFSLLLKKRAQKVPPSFEQQKREYLIIVKDILEREKNALDRKLAGCRICVFIPAALDLRDRIRDLVKSLHIPTNDGKEEDSVPRVNSAAWNSIFLTKTFTNNGKERKYKGAIGLCYS